MNYKIAKAVGLNTDKKAAQVTVSSDDPNNVFTAVLELACDDAFTVGRQALSDLEDFYIQSEQENASEKLKEAFVKSQELLSELEFSVILASISGKVLYLIGKGDVECYLRRIDKISKLDVSSGQLTSGFLQEGDRVLLATKNFISFLGNDLGHTMELSIMQWEDEIGEKVSIDGMPELEEGEIPTQSAARAGLIIDVQSEVEEEALKVISESKEPQKIVRIGNIRNFFPGGRKLRLIMALILIIVIGLGVGLKYKNFKDQEKLNQFNEFLQVAKDNFNEAQGLQTLNPSDAQSKILIARENIEKALNLIPKNKEAQDLKKQIEEGGNIQKYDNVGFSEFLDLDLVKKGFGARQMSLSVGKLLLLNPDDSTLVLIDISKKSQKILAGKEKIGDAKAASINGDSAFVYSKDKGVLRIDTGSEKASSSAKLDKEWGEIVDLVGFGGNFYLLDKTDNQIWKYLVISGGYSDKRKYLADEVKVDFGSALKMQIESSVYVLKQGGEILRFTRGSPDNFSIGGLDKGLPAGRQGIKDPKSFFVSSDTENLYILDSGNSRLVAISKTGEYKAQYSGDKFATATDLVVDEKGKKVYLLEGSKIYVVDLK